MFRHYEDAGIRILSCQLLDTEVSSFSMMEIEQVEIGEKPRFQPDFN